MKAAAQEVELPKFLLFWCGLTSLLGTMTFFRVFAALAMASALFSPSAQGQAILDSLTSDLNIEGLETTYDPTTGLALAKGDVRINYADVEIRCGQASYNSTTGEVIARENVVIWKAGVTYKGDNIIYNANSGEISGDAVRSALPMEIGNLFYETDRIETETKLIQKVEGGETFLTSHDSEDPNFRLRARSLTIQPGDKVTLRGVTVLAGDTPVFYLPVVSQSLDQEMSYRFNIGSQSRWGAFMLNQYTVMHGDHTQGRYHLDLRSSRGVAVGADWLSMRYRKNWQNFSGLKIYYLNDSDPDQNRTAAVRGPVPDNRYRINFQHRIYLPGPEKSTWYLDFDINKISDQHFYEDFFFNDFRETPEPDNQVSLVHVAPAYIATLMARFQANDFYTVGEKLPELAIDWTRRQLWNTGIYHQGTAAIGYLRESASDLEERALQSSIDGLAGKPLSGSDRDANRSVLGLGLDSSVGGTEFSDILQLMDAGMVEYTRLHTYHEFLYPKTFGGWLNVVPRLGVGVTHYAGLQRTVDGLPSANKFSSETKPIFHAGLDLSFKLTKTWEDYTNEALGLDGLRHVMQPYVNISYLDASQTDGFPGVDRLTPTTRPRPIDVPLYSAVDGLSSWNITRVGLKNYLQTRRDYTSEGMGRFTAANDDPTQTYTFAGMNTYVDLFAHDPEFDRSISNLYNELFFRPVPWINLWMDMQLPIVSEQGNFTEFNQGVTFMPSDSMSVTLGHQFINDNPYFQDSNLFFSRIYARITDNWGFAMNHVFEADDGTMEFQSYSITRDLTSWVASLGAMQRDNRNGQSEFGLLFTLTLKDFPNLTIPLDIDPNPSGRGGNQ
jgi:lipopolysaccharide assembly outer membrane protein LptD (OstA)